ncbi:AI-2E family transporter [Glaciihabitans tibetensis]|uniref:AI-2E family transporter n=1 Tax=Glaciihabitans tibetensis TaxID=1266600 RepID=UPI0011B2972A|nr:AI-2E family transporter [Glaciihabitans tibetensis]
MTATEPAAETSATSTAPPAPPATPAPPTTRAPSAPPSASVPSEARATQAPSPKRPSASRTSSARLAAFGKAFGATAGWVARGLIILLGLIVVWLVLRALWSIVLPMLFALLLSSILWPVNRVLRRALPKALAALLSVAGLLAVVVGIGLIVIPLMASGASALASSASANIAEIGDFFAQPPFNFPDYDLAGLVDAGITQVRENGGAVVSGITAGLGTITSWTVVFLLTMVLTFFCLKDGDKFLRWTRRWTNGRTFVHAAKISEGVWQTLSAYISSQAIVALVDAVFIGIGLALLGIPLALPLAVLIFFAAFIPIVGAVATGMLATVVALLSHGWGTALIVLGIVLLVQQLESNLLQPAIVGKVLKIHPAVVLGSVVVGGTIFGIVGAFLAVPTTAAVIVVMRYLRSLSLSGHDDGFEPGSAAADAAAAKPNTEAAETGAHSGEADVADLDAPAAR